ncbi:MAG TPA: hypothetical protein VMH28_24645 [Candidatus Acidoferrales bacterium]|nr:hypothetical protein [Candidatus Acidoferrales bacterium]
MNERIMTRGFPWGEPAHPGIVKQYEDLIAIYKNIRAQLQETIDRAFDRVSRDVGFVVTTTIPATLEIAEGGKPAQWTMAEPIQGSLFEKAMMEVVKTPAATQWKEITAGKYQLYLIWYDALKLKLRKDWLEPVHYLREEVIAQLGGAAQVRPEVREPAHWFLPAVTIAAEEKILIAAIDEVYPELQLAQRVSATRQALRGVRPEVMEPAHFRAGQAELAMREIANVFKRVGPGIPEPAHHLAADRDLLAQIEAVIRKYGA